MIEDIKRLKTELEEEISNVNSMNDLSDLRLLLKIRFRY